MGLAESLPDGSFWDSAQHLNGKPQTPRDLLVVPRIVTAKDEAIANGQTLLTDALRDPLAEEPARRWFEHLVAVVPLWAFQAKAYVHVHDSELPTTYPLRLMAESIQEDEKPLYQRRKPRAWIRELIVPAKQFASAKQFGGLFQLLAHLLVHSDPRDAGRAR